MITKSLFDKILIEPAEGGADRLCVVSGYATAAMAFHHLEEALKRTGRLPALHLVVGMCTDEGLSESNHRGFQKLAQDE